jgi:hypothetical protein
MPAAERFDPYRILGVPRDVSSSQLARAYRQQAKRVHPDLHGAPEASRQMRDLNRSWQILSDPVRRREWDASHPATQPQAHWPPDARPPAAPQRVEPARWASWETARRSTAPGPDRVRPAEAWPRRADAPAAPGGMRDSGWLAAGVAGVLVVAIVVLGWVASTRPAAASADEAFDQARVPVGARVAVDPTHELAVYEIGGGMLGIAVARRGEGGWEASVLDERVDDSSISVRLARDDSGSGWRSVVYGRAPAEVARVRLSVASQGGEVSDGLWVIGVRAPLRPEQVLWRFEAFDGSVLVSGNGELH